MTQPSILIKQGQVVDPVSGINEPLDIFIQGHRIVEINKKSTQQATHVIEASGLTVTPGFIDIQARMREPGYEYIASIQSETAAAVAQGCTTLIIPPDTVPIIDNAATAEWVVNRARNADTARVYATGALTQGLAGESLAEMGLLKQAGCVAVSNADQPVINTQTLMHALEYASTIDIPVILNPVEPWLNNGSAHEGSVSTRYGLTPISEECELIGLYRILSLVKKTQVKAIIGPLSCGKSMELVQAAKAEGAQIHAFTTIHHLLLTDLDCAGFNSIGHVLPPLRSQRDQQSLQTALKTGAIDFICSDHRPWRNDDRLMPFEQTEPGLSGIDTFFSASLKLAQSLDLPITDFIRALSTNAAQALNLELGRLQVGAKADLCLFDPNQHWQVSASNLRSHGHNNPFIGWQLPGVVHTTIKSGKVVYQHSA